MSRYFTFPQAQSGYYLRKYLHDVIQLEHKLVESSWKLNNQVLIPFLKENGVKYEKMNPRYKGLCTANLINSHTIVESKELWNKFKTWCKNNYSKTI
jgi:hypothetical protein